MRKINVDIVLCIVILFTSCVKDVDFNQAKDLVVKPAYVTSLMQFSINQTGLFDKITNTEIIEIKNTYGFSFIDKLEGKEQIEKVVLDFEFHNPFNRKFTAQYSFFDANDMATHSVNIEIPANADGSKHREEILIANNPNLFNTTKIHSKMRLLPSPDGSVIDVNTQKTLKIVLSGIFYLNVKL